MQSLNVCPIIPAWGGLRGLLHSHCPSQARAPHPAQLSASPPAAACLHLIWWHGYCSRSAYAMGCTQIHSIFKSVDYWYFTGHTSIFFHVRFTTFYVVMCFKLHIDCKSTWASKVFHWGWSILTLCTNSKFIRPTYILLILCNGCPEKNLISSSPIRENKQKPDGR